MIGSDLAEKRKKKRIKNKKKSIPVIISTVVLCAAVLLCLVVTIQTLAKGYTSFFGYSVFRVVTGSMEPTIPTGAVLICKSDEIENVEVDDIVCFRSRESSHYGAIVTHRVASIRFDENGNILLETHGDANYSSDPYFVQKENYIGKVTWFTGKEGVFTKVLSFISGKIGFMALIVIPILIIVAFILQGVGRNIRGELDSALERLAKKDSPPDDELLPGYKTLTKRDYEEIYESLKRELGKELNSRVKANNRENEDPERKKI